LRIFSTGLRSGPARGLNKHGVAVRYRQDVVVNLLQYVHPESLGAPKPPSSGGGRPHPKHRFHYVKKGQTLRKISALEYGNQRWWRDIAKANKIRDPKSLKVGQRLRLP
jgi:nucleoid-associated protein YgaU